MKINNRHDIEPSMQTRKPSAACRLCRAIGIFAVLAGVGISRVAAASGEAAIEQMQKTMAKMEAQLTDMRRDIAAIKAQLAASPKTGSSAHPASSPASSVPTGEYTTVPLGDDPTLGASSASLVLIEYIDFQCPYCARFHQNVLPKIEAAYIQTGKLRYLHRDLPLTASHAAAQEAAEAAHCAGIQKYWSMVDRYFADPKAVSARVFSTMAQSLGVDLKEFNICMTQKRHTESIQQDVEEARRVGVRGTPTFLLGKVGADHRVTGNIIRGAKPFEFFQQEIERLLNSP